MPSGAMVSLVPAIRRITITTLAIFWVAGVVLSARYLLRYEKTPGRLDSAPLHWPQGVAEAGDKRLPTLVVVLHPRCSCSRASLTELKKAAESFQTPFNALLLLSKPSSGGGDLQKMSSMDTLRDWHAQVVLDEDGALAARFGAQTSGEVILYSAEDLTARRNLLYAGGVTGARGMEGENPGAEALVRAFREQRHQASRPVFGCGLFSFGPDGKSSVALTGTERPRVTR